MKEIIERIKRLKESYPDRFKFFPSVNEKYTGPLTLYSPVDIDLIAYTEELLSLELDNNLKELYSFSNGLTIASYFIYSLKTKKKYVLADENLTKWEHKPHLKHKFIAFMGCRGGGPDYGYLVDENGGQPRVAILKEQLNYDYELVNDCQVIAPSIYDFFNIFLDKIEPQIQALGKNDTYVYIPEWED